MSVLALPASSKPVVVLAFASQAVATYLVFTHGHAGLWAALSALAVSAYLADLFTGLAHFGFDYVFPDRMPILGPISVEFRDHHSEPTLDPSDYWVNFSKGAYASLPVSLIVCLSSLVTEESALSFWIFCTATGTSFWALFFHQIHSYAHMGSHLSPEEFNNRASQISALPTKKKRIKAFRELFADEPIPPFIRFLQDFRILLNPGVHNLHHIEFETDFSSVNGWSDPLCNLFLAPIARRLKDRSPSR